MKLFSVIPENFRMDGGACFGVVPKVIWEKFAKPDENNLIPLASRCMLADTGDRIILVDVGMGNKQSEKFFGFYHLFGVEGLEKSLAAHGYKPDQVTDVILTHLHFDHVGGAVKWGADGKTPELVFPNATYYCSKAQWDTATDPNPREKASYFMENLMPLFESGHLEFIYEEGPFCEGIHLEIKNGHTIGQIVPFFEVQGRTLVYMADFIAAVGNIPLPYVPSFDIDPVLSMEEKEEFLNRAVDKDYVLFFEHDFDNECCTVKNTPKGVRADKVFTLPGFLADPKLGTN